MTQKRYFYTDPLAAAWMMKHFRMRIHTGGGDMCDFRADFCMDRYEENLLSLGGKLYIHPASLPLLEPQKGDKVSYSWGYGEHRSEGWDEVKAIISAGDEAYAVTGNGERCVLMDSGDYPYISRITRIFQRNGLPYMWPDSEAA